MTLEQADDLLPFEEQQTDQQRIDHPSPPRAIPGREDLDIEFTFLLIHRTVVMQDSHTERITARRQSHIGDVGLTYRGLDPHIIEAFQPIGKAGLVIHAAIVGGHQDRKLVLSVLQRDAALLVKGLFQDHTTIHISTHLHQLSEEFQSAEHRLFLTVVIIQTEGADDVQSFLTTNQQMAIARTVDSTLVKRSRLQSVAVIITAHHEGPGTVILLLGDDVRHTVIRRHPHRVTRILCHRHRIRTMQARLHIQQRSLVVLPVEHGDASRRTKPDQPSAVHHCLRGGF